MSNDNTQIKISIIIAAFNSGNYLRECLDSIFDQTIRDIEVILIDDGSTDDTQEIVMDSYSDKPNLIYCFQNNSGAGMARNAGISVSKGKYIAFMDPDDKYPNKDSLERLYTVAEEHGVMVCGGNIIGFKGNLEYEVYTAGMGDGSHTKNGVIKAIDYYHLYGHTRYLYRASLIKKHRILFLKWRRFEDQVFTIKSLAISENFYELDYPVYYYRMSENKRYDNSVWIDILHGYVDTLEALVSCNMKLMFQKNVDGLIRSMVGVIRRNDLKDDVEIKKITEAIDRICSDSGWWNKSSEEYFGEADSIDEFVKGLENEKKPIIIYGAGKNTRRLLDVYGEFLKDKIVGIAVTDPKDSNNTYCGELEVRKIDDYSDYKEGIVLITPAYKYKTSIENLVKSKGFYNCYWIDVQLIY